MTKQLLVLFSTILLLSACSEQEPAAIEQTKTNAAEVLGNKVADWQLAHMDDFAYIRTFRDQTEQSMDWIQAAFYIGLTRWTATTDNPDYYAALLDTARRNEWQMESTSWHADNQAIVQMYLFLAGRESAAQIEHVTRAFDEILSSPPQNSLKFVEDADGETEGTCQKRWCWCDALFMAPPAWAMLSNVTDDAKYREYGLQEYFATQDYLYDDQVHLFYRDSRFFERETSFGNKIFWSRGNGWVFAGLPLLLEALPEDHASRERLLQLYKEMAATFRSIQHPNGYWSSSLLDVEHDPSPETSGTGFITFGLAWGVNRDILSKDEYGPVVEKGWSMIGDAVDDQGKLGWVQQVGSGPDEVRETDTQLYGTGAFLLAASEMLHWEN